LSFQIVPLNSSPNQSFLANLTVNKAALKLNLSISFNEIAQYWTMQIADVNNNVLIAEIPLVTGSWPAANLLSQFQYMMIGSCYLLNVSNGGTTLDYPNGSDLGTDFTLLWGDNV
jgi:hypothetical protein